jgi:hypothetical protein
VDQQNVSLPVLLSGNLALRGSVETKNAAAAFV